jgi:cobalt/nickel transport system permease protein
MLLRLKPSGKDRSMRHDFLDRYSRISSPIHDLPAGLKVGAAILLILFFVTVPTFSSWTLGGVAFLLVIALVSTIPGGFLIKRLLLLEPFVLGIAVLGLFQNDGGRIVLAILLRSTLCLLTIILLSNTTPFSELLSVLRRIRVPALFVTVLALMYRYLFVLIDETERMQRARKSRTFSRSRKTGWRLFSTVVGQLFIRSADRAERIYAAMCARGWK